MPRAPRRRRKLPAQHKGPGPDVDGVLFRAKVRLTAVGYGAREQAWRLSRGFEYRVEKPLHGFWLGLRRRTRRIIVVGTALVLALAFLFYTPAPGVPCQVSAVKECAPTDDVLSMVPADALLYSHLTLDRGSAQFKAVDSLLGRFSPHRVDQIGSALLPAPSGVGISFVKDVRPWAGDDAGLVVVPGPGPATSSAFVIAVKDQKGAEAFLEKVAPGPGAGISSAFDRGFLVVGGGPAVRAVAATGAAGAKTLGEAPSAEQVRGELPANRFADLYFSAAGIRRLLAGSTTTLATQLETFVDYGASTGFAVAALAKDDGIELEVYSALDPARQKASPNLFTTLPHFKPALTGDVGARALGYVGLGEAGESLGLLLQRAGGAAPGLGSVLRSLTDRISAKGKVDPARDLLPALGGQAALVAQPTDGVPFASLIVDDVDEPKAKEVLAQLQGPLARSVGSPPGQPPAVFRPITLHGGVEGSELQVSPTVDLTYAVFDGKLVVSTQPAGVEQVAAGSGETLDRADAFHDVTAALPDRVSALLYLNLDELLDLAEKLGQVEDPLYVAFRDDIRKLHAIAVGVDAGAHDLRSRLLIAIS
jgi:hypothetical protein